MVMTLVREGVGSSFVVAYQVCRRDPPVFEKAALSQQKVALAELGSACVIDRGAICAAWRGKNGGRYAIYQFRISGNWRQYKPNHAGSTG
jgi:hypothetical protein